MGNETRGHSQPPAAVKSSSTNTESLSSAKPSARPMSIAPKALAVHLDDGWGEEDTGESADETVPGLVPSALAPAKVPQFESTPPPRDLLSAADDVTASHVKPLLKPLNLPTSNRVSASKSSAPNTLGLPAAAKPTKVSSAPTKEVQTLSVAPLSAPTASEPSAFELPKVLTIPPKTATESVLPKALTSLVPSSVPPPVDDDAEWDVQAPAPSIAPSPQAKVPSKAPSTLSFAESETKAPSSPDTAHAPILSQRGSESAQPFKRSVTPTATKAVSLRPASTPRNSQPPVAAALEVAEPPKSADLESKPLASPVEVAEPPLTKETPSKAVTRPDVQAALEKREVLLPKVSEAHSSATVVEFPRALKGAVASDAQTSMSPVVSADFDPGVKTQQRTSKTWFFVAAAAIVVGSIWGAVGARRASPAKPPTVVAATPQPEAPKPAAAPVAAVPAPQQPASDPTTPVAAPPTTNDPGKPAVATADAAPTASEDVKPSEPADIEVAKVKVEVIPTDSTVALYGKEVTGPLVFEVKKGTRTILEVARPGYVTRRIVLDGKKPFMRIMMTAVPKPKAPDGEGSSGAFGPSDAPTTPTATPPQSP